MVLRGAAETVLAGFDHAVIVPPVGVVVMRRRAVRPGRSCAACGLEEVLVAATDEVFFCQDCVERSDPDADYELGGGD